MFMKVTNMSLSSVLTHPSCDDFLQPTVTEDFGHLPPEQRRKRLQQKLEEISKELQKEADQRYVHAHDGFLPICSNLC